MYLSNSDSNAKLKDFSPKCGLIFEMGKKVILKYKNFMGNSIHIFGNYLSCSCIFKLNPLVLCFPLLLHQRL